MAEGLLRALGGERFEVFSAGTKPKGLHPLAVQVMKEVGVDISGQRSKHVDVYREQAFDWVITVCDNAREECPFFPNARHQLHWSFPDPAAVEGALEERLEAFRAVRDSIRRRITEFIETLPD